jgi:hypothetical protein
MTTAVPLFQILYVSQLRPDSDIGVVKDIVAVSRRTNPSRGITGALVFDGEHFGQLLEGHEAEVVALMRRIEADSRHHRLTILASGVAGAAREMRVWRSGYCEGQQLDVFFTDESRRGPAALAVFLAILQDADLE